MKHTVAGREAREGGDGVVNESGIQAAHQHFHSQSLNAATVAAAAAAAIATDVSASVFR